MATTIEQDAAALFQRALKENQLGLVSALKITVPAGDLADALKREITPDHVISQAWADALTRPAYDLLDARKLTSVELMSNPSYAQFFTTMFESTKDLDSQHVLLQGLTAAGQHTLALKLFSQLADPAAFVSHFKKYLATVTAHYSAYYFTETGTTKDLTPATLELMDKLDLDVPANFTAGNYPNSSGIGYKIWNQSRFKMNVSRVGEVIDTEKLEIPSAKRLGSGPVVITNGALANAYIAEYARIDAGLGSWHRENFPRYLPVLADANCFEELRARGGVRIKPKYTNEHQDHNGVSIINPSHGFSPVNPGDDLDPKDIRLAMSMLSLQQVTSLIETENQHVVLVPAEQLQALVVEPTETPEALRIALRYHRPELLVTDLSNVYDGSHSSFPTSLYLRGIEVQYSKYQYLYLYSGLDEDPSYPSLFVTEQETAGLLKTYTTDRRHYTDVEQLMIREFEHLTLAENVTNAHAVLEAVSEKMGFTPAVSFRGSPEFMKALAASRIKTTEPGGITDINGGIQDWHLSDDGRRVAACLGSVGYEYDLLKMSASELLTKGCRTKNSGDGKTMRLRILGVLDRLPLEDLVANIKTDAQFKFAHENFDLMPLVQTLPKKFSLIVAGENFSKDLGL